MIYHKGSYQTDRQPNKYLVNASCLKAKCYKMNTIYR